MNREKRIILQFTLGTLLFLVFIALLNWAFAPQGDLINNWQIDGPGIHTQKESPFLLKAKKTGVYRFTAAFPMTENDLLVLPRPAGQSLQVEVNGQIVGKFGSLRKPTSNYWNSSFAYPLPKSCRYSHNQITITVYGLHDAGLPFVPYTTKSADVSQKLDMQVFLSQSITWITMGMATVLATLLLLLFFQASTSRRWAYLLITLACVFCVIYNLDFIERHETFALAGFLIWRKIILSSLFLAGAFMFIGLYSFYNKPRQDYWLPLLFLLPVPFLIFAPSFYTLQENFSYVSPVMFIIMPVLLFKERKRISGYLFFTFSFFCCCAIQSLGILFNWLHQIYTFSLGITALFLGMALMLIQQMIQLEGETEKLKDAANRDPLTGLFNRKHLESLTFNKYDSLFFMDLDGFKAINDTQGHAQGDKVLKLVAETLTSETRRTDEVIRYGGDEFIIVFRRADQVKPHSFIHRIEERLNSCNPPVTFSYGITVWQENLQKTIDLADQEMYAMKKTKMGRSEIRPSSSG